MERNNEVFTPPDGGYGWVVVLAATLINISLLPLVQCFGIIYQDTFMKMGVTSAETSFLLHLHSAIYCSLGLLGSPLLKKYDFRRVALFGTFLMCCGIFLSSFTKSYGILLCTVSILIGVGQGILIPAIFFATNTYFKKRLTLTVSFSVTGSSISSIIMPIVCHKLLTRFQDTQPTVLVLSGLSLVGILCCFLLKPIKKPEKKDVEQNVTKPNEKEELELLNCQDQIYKETTVTVKKKSILTKIHELFNLELLNDRPYVIAIIGMSISFASELNIILMMTFILPDIASFERKDVAYAISVQSIADVIGRLVVPMIAHYFSVSPRIMYGASLITSTVGRTVMAVFYSSKVTIFACVSLIGLARGIKAVYQSVIIPKYVTLEKLPAANGLNMLLTGAASLALGPIIGAIKDVSNSYVYALHTGSLFSMSCVLLWTCHYFLYERTKQTAPSSS